MISNAKAVRDAIDEAERDDVGQCKTCTSLAEEGDVFCRYCASYWKDVRNGLWDKEEYQ